MPVRPISNILLVAGVAAVVAGCGTARRGEPLAGPLPQASPGMARGEAIFERKCGPCHPGGEAGVGPALNDKPLPRFMMKFQVRKGFGAMPSFPEATIGEEDLDLLIDYLVALRRHKPGA